MKKNLPQDKWPQIPGVFEHLERTGEKPPAGYAMTPADMVGHGGYGVRLADGTLRGPFAWAENARRAAGKLSGATVVLFKRARGLAPSTR